jgi:DNA polymerase III subunit chi
MTQVDFYFNAADLQHVTQRLIAKALAAKAATVVVTADTAMLAAFDAYLWAFDAASFVPHLWLKAETFNTANDRNAALLANTPVILLNSDAPAAVLAQLPASHDSLMINCGTALPAHFARFTRLIELVASDEASKTKGRERFMFYKQRGYPMSHLDLKKA